MFAPKIPRIGFESPNKITAKKIPVIKDPYVINEDTFFIRFSFFSPMAIDAAALPPIPNIFANAMNKIKIGLVRLTAATVSYTHLTLPTKLEV